MKFTFSYLMVPESWPHADLDGYKCIYIKWTKDFMIFDLDNLQNRLKLD